MKLPSVCAALVIATLTANAVAQESTPEDFKAYCKAMEGRWVGEVTWVADWPGLGKRGDTVTAYSENVIAEDGNALVQRFYGGNGSATGITAFDAGAKRIKAMWVVSGGHVGYGIIYKKGGKWHQKATGSNPDGTKTKGSSTLTVSDDGNTHSWKGKGSVGDKPTDDRHDVWRRVSK
jgi:hypothetical protein